MTTTVMQIETPCVVTMGMCSAAWHKDTAGHQGPLMHLQSYVPNHAPQSLRFCHCDTHQESSEEAAEEYCSPLSPTSLPWILWAAVWFAPVCPAGLDLRIWGIYTQIKRVSANWAVCGQLFGFWSTWSQSVSGSHVAFTTVTGRCSGLHICFDTNSHLVTKLKTQWLRDISSYNTTRWLKTWNKLLFTV